MPLCAKTATYRKKYQAFINFCASAGRTYAIWLYFLQKKIYNMCIKQRSYTASEKTPNEVTAMKQEITIRNDRLQIISYIEIEDNGNKTVRDFYRRVIARGDIVGILFNIQP